MSFVYLRLLIYLPAILIPACASSRPAFLMMYSAYKFNKQVDNTQPWCTPRPIWNQSVVPCSRTKNGGEEISNQTDNSLIQCFECVCFHKHSSSARNQQMTWRNMWTRQIWLIGVCSVTAKVCTNSHSSSWEHKSNGFRNWELPTDACGLAQEKVKNTFWVRAELPWPAQRAPSNNSDLVLLSG